MRKRCLVSKLVLSPSLGFVLLLGRRGVLAERLLPICFIHRYSRMAGVGIPGFLCLVAVLFMVEDVMWDISLG